MPGASLRRLAFALVVVASLALAMPYDRSSDAGRSRGCREDTTDCHTELSILNYTDCFCHNYTGSPTVTIDINYPSVVEAGEKRIINATIHGGPGAKFGLGVNTSKGFAEPYFSNSTSNAFSINYTAPDKPCDDEIKFAYLSADGDGNQTNDTWYSKTVKIKVIQRQTDILVKSLSIPKEAKSGTKFTISAVVSNLGNYSHSNVTIVLSIDGDEATRWNKALSQGSDTTVEFKVALKAGRHNIRLSVDPACVIDETDESNNVATKMIDVRDESPCASPIVVIFTIFGLAIALSSNHLRFRI